MKGILFILISFWGMFSYASPLHTLEAEININAPIEEVFELAGNAANDKLWRSEVRKVLVTGNFIEGSSYLETAILGLHFGYKTETQLVDLYPPYKAAYRTTAGNPFRLMSERSFRKISANVTKFIYRVEVEEDLVKDIWRGALSPKMAVKGYKLLVKAYMRKLKKLLEK